MRVFPLVTGRTFGADESILEEVKNKTSLQVLITSLQDCDVMLLFCPITSRIRADVEAALRRVEGNKQNFGQERKTFTFNIYTTVSAN